MIGKKQCSLFYIGKENRSMIPACSKHSVCREERKEKASTNRGRSYTHSHSPFFGAHCFCHCLEQLKRLCQTNHGALVKITSKYVRYFSPLSPTRLLRPNAYSKSCSFYSTHSFCVMKPEMAATAFSNVNKQLSSDPKTRFHLGLLRLCSFS